MRLIDHDPEIDKFKTLFQRENLREKDFAVLAGLSYATVHKLFDSQTKRPQGLTYRKMAIAMGYEYTLVREGGRPDYDSEIPLAHNEYKMHLKALKKAREKGNGKRKPK